MIQILKLSEESIINRIDNPDISKEEVEFLFDLLMSYERGIIE